jgi:hypothetical protein
MRLLLIVSIILVSACGKKDLNLLPEKQKNLWGEEVLNSRIQACAQNGNYRSGEPIQQWTTYCSCTLSSAASQWTITEYDGNFQTCLDQLYAQNIIQDCTRKAFGGNH